MSNYTSFLISIPDEHSPIRTISALWLYASLWPNLLKASYRCKKARGPLFAHSTIRSEGSIFFQHNVYRPYHLPSGCYYGYFGSLSGLDFVIMFGYRFGVIYECVSNTCHNPFQYGQRVLCYDSF
jgi:hypothetical protein